MNVAASMNLPNEAPTAVVVQSQILSPSSPHIERCEFEQLLQRAMEILNARDLAAQLHSSSGS